jgi:hypothetical protein
MAHFAEIDENNKVLRVLVVADEHEDNGHHFLSNELNLGGVWIQTSYNTRGGIHFNFNTNEQSLDQSKAFRKNFAQIDYTYDEERDAFIAPKPFTKWVLNEETCIWEAPVPYPTDGLTYVWNNNKEEWEEYNDTTSN